MKKKTIEHTALIICSESANSESLSWNYVNTITTTITITTTTTTITTTTTTIITTIITSLAGKNG